MSPTAPTEDPGPLAGVRILDFSTLLPGPMATLILAQAGAEVIKVEHPDGDRMREHPADFTMLNQGKRSIAVDLKAPGARDSLTPLLRAADVVVSQFRPGVMERLGLGWDVLRAINPRLIWCAITGYGSDGPLAHQPGHDLTYAADAGMLAQTAAADGSPTMPSVLLADIGGGSYPAVINILLALRRRDRTGQGSCFEISLYEQIFPFLYPAFASAFGRGHWPLPGDSIETGASPRYSLYRAGDGRWLAVGCTEPKFWAAFCDAIGLPQALRDDSMDPEATRRAVAALLDAKPAAEWLRLFEGRDVVCSLVRTFREATEAPHFPRARLFPQSSTLETPPPLPLPLVDAMRRPDSLCNAPALGEANAALLAPPHLQST